MRKPHRSDRDPAALRRSDRDPSVLRVRFGAGDLASPLVHSLARAAMDLAAGRVRIAAMASVAVGLPILVPPLWRRLAGG